MTKKEAHRIAAQIITDPNVERIRQVRREMYAGCDTTEKFLKRVHEIFGEPEADLRKGLASKDPKKPKSSRAKTRSTQLKSVIE